MLEFRPDQTVLETWKTPDVLGLHPRDVYLFASDVGIGQRAMLAARGGEAAAGQGPGPAGGTRQSHAEPAEPSRPAVGCSKQGPAGWHCPLSMPSPRLPRAVPCSSCATPARRAHSVPAGAILFRTDVCKAVIYHDRAVLFPCRCGLWYRAAAQRSSWGRSLPVARCGRSRNVPAVMLLLV